MQLFQLTLMKGDKGVEMLKKFCDPVLLFFFGELNGHFCILAVSNIKKSVHSSTRRYYFSQLIFNICTVQLNR